MYVHLFLKNEKCALNAFYFTVGRLCMLSKMSYSGEGSTFRRSWKNRIGKVAKKRF